jgi:GMP synthase (glutamine-hydrolysing)
VGVQGDSRTYRPVIALEAFPASETAAADLINRRSDVNRVVALAGSHAPLRDLAVRKAHLSAARLNRLRRADAIVRAWSHRTGFESKVWQFPVVLLPAGAGERPDSVVLRPVDSLDGMTARWVPMDPAARAELCQELLSVEGVAAVFYDLTNKPPATIEWE